MYVERPEFVDTLVDFVRSRPAQPVDAFLAQTEAAMAHDASAVLGEIDAPTLITFGARDLVCSTRFAEPLKSGIAGSELVVFEHLSHAGLHEDPRHSTAQRSISCCASPREGRDGSPGRTTRCCQFCRIDLNELDCAVEMTPSVEHPGSEPFADVRSARSRE